MARRVASGLLFAALLLAGPLAGLALADHSECAPFERLPYDFTVEFHHGGDLFSRLHVVGYTDFRFCFELRDRVLKEEIRWEARGGAYELRIVGEGFDDLHTLRQGANTTGWYRHADVAALQVVGVSSELEPIVIPAESPPASSLAPALRPAWLR